MSIQSTIEEKILTSDAALAKWLHMKRFKSVKIIFTNGCFDLLHDGHLQLLTQAKMIGGQLIVGINSDASVKRLKGPSRPIKNQDSRALQLAALLMVDAVVIFEEDTPLELIKKIQPNVLVKGSDYNTETIVGAGEVLSHGGTVEIIPLVQGFSTTNLIEKIK